MREIRAGEWDNSRYSQRSAAAAVSRLSKRNRHVFLRKNPDIGGRSCGEAEETYDSKPNPNTNLARHRLYQKAGSFEFALVFLVPPPGSQPATFLRLTLLTWLAIAIQHREVCPRRTSHLCTHAYFGHADELSRGVETISDDTLLMAVLKAPWMEARAVLKEVQGQADTNRGKRPGSGDKRVKDRSSHLPGQYRHQKCRNRNPCRACVVAQRPPRITAYSEPLPPPVRVARR